MMMNRRMTEMRIMQFQAFKDGFDTTFFDEAIEELKTALSRTEAEEIDFTRTQNYTSSIEQTVS
ncbi:hypothetical protein AASFL403_12095 [Paenibacillus nuruki]|nr:hypothetical protein AASFL403_12095 [Paenibacillus nuruki]